MSHKMNRNIGRDMGDRDNGMQNSDMQFLAGNDIFQHVFELSMNGIAILATNGHFMKVNRSFCNITGYAEEELLSLDFRSITHPGDLEPSHKYDLAMKNGQISSFQIEKRYIHKLGHTVWVKLSNNRHYDGMNQCFYNIIQIVEITEYKQTENMLRENDQRYRQLLKLMPEPIAIHSEGILVYVNDAGIELIGAGSQEEVVGKPIFDFIHPDLHHSASVKQIINGDSRGYSEFQLFRTNGEVKEVEVCSTKVNEILGKPVIQTIIRDITERKRTEEFLRRSDKLSAVGQLAAGVAHEIRNPLTAIKGFVQLIQSRTKENGYYLDIMLSELERINNIVSEFMLLAKPEQVIHHKLKDIRKLIQDILTLLNTQAILNNVQVSTEFDLDVQSILCDENQMKQVFVNVVKNAIEAMPNGGQLVIQVKHKNKRHILIRFIDQGSGIPKERLSKLGEPFYSTKEKGTGLGLMMCYKIIEAHHGEMLIKSKLNKGTTIDVVLPVMAENG